MVLHFDILIFSKCFKRLAAGDAGPGGGIPGHELLRRAARLHHVAAGLARWLARERLATTTGRTSGDFGV